MLLANSDKIVAISPCEQFIIISLCDVPDDDMLRTTYREGSKDLKGAIDACLHDANKGHMSYRGGDPRHQYRQCFVAVKTDHLRIRCPGWFKDGDKLLDQYQAANQADKKVIFTADEKEVISKIWSAQLAEKVKKSEDEERLKDRLQVVCQGNYVEDHEGIPVKILPE